MLTTIGEALFDLLLPDDRAAPESSTVHMQAGGAPFNVAVTLARMGHPVRFCGALSEDGLGARLRSILIREGIEIAVEAPVTAQTRLALVDHADEGGAFRFYGDAPADVWLRESDIDRALNSATGIYVSSLMMTNEWSRAVQERAIELAHEREIPVFCDPNPRPSAWRDSAEMRQAVAQLLVAADVAKLSLDDLHLMGLAGTPEKLAVEVSSRVPGQIVVTDGERGCWAIVDDAVVHVTAPAVAAVDPTGAGDAFSGALIARCLEDGQITEPGLRFAAAAGALATTRHGAVAAIPRRDEVERLAER